MSKKAKDADECIMSAVDVARVYAGMLMCYMDKESMRNALRQPRKNGRLYAYADIVRDACRQFFRIRDGKIHVYDGKKWSSIQWVKGGFSGSSELSIDFNLIVREAFVNCCDDSFGIEIAKSDWVDREGKIMEYAIQGVMSSPMCYDATLVGFRNGIWDFKDIYEPVRHDFKERLGICELLPYDFDADATCPVWLGFLNTMLPSSDIDTLQKFFGLGIVNRKMLGRSVEESLWLIGDGANGKSTILNVLTGLYGSWNISNTRLDALLDRNNIVRMMSMSAIEGKLFNICTEISGTDIEHGSDMFKSLVSGEAQNVRGIGQDIHTAYDIPYFIFSMNQMPVHKKMDDAFRRRMVTIDFRSSVRREDMDRSLGVKLAKEYSGIRNWAIEGYKRFVSDGFTTKRTIRGAGLTNEEVDNMIANGQTVDLWKADVGIRASRSVGHEDDEVDVWVKKSTLYEDYSNYCINRLQCPVGSDNQLGRDLHRLHFESQRKAGGMCYRVYCDKTSKFYINNKL